MVTASREFQVFAKPIGAACNLDCRYCYYLKKQGLYPKAASLRMSEELLENYIIQHIRACPISMVHFSWHGGEPTLLGVDYFRKVVDFQRKHRVPGREILNGIQTNGTLLDEEWCRFLAAEDFYVGLSLDGPEDLHNAYRVSKNGVPTHAQVMNGFQLMQRHRVHCDVLCVVHNINVHRPLEVYRYFKDIGARYLVFLPLVVRAEDGGVSPDSVSAEAYGAFLCAIFDEWIREDISRIYVQIFDEAARPYRGLEHSVCTLRKTCGELPVLEHNGDLYSCDHYVDREHYIGNIGEKSLVELLESASQRAFGQSKWDSLPQSCRRCKVLEFCNGGCPKDRLITTQDGEPGLNYLCAAFRRFHTHARPHLRRLASFIQTAQPIEQFSELVRSGYAKAPVAAGRNDPCPCGSGKKFKKCCGASIR